MGNKTNDPLNSLTIFKLKRIPFYIVYCNQIEYIMHITVAEGVFNK